MIEAAGPIGFLVAVAFEDEGLEVGGIPTFLAEHLIDLLLIRAVVGIEGLCAVIHINQTAVGSRQMPTQIIAKALSP